MKDLHNKKDYQDTSFPLHIFIQTMFQCQDIPLSNVTDR